MYRARGIQECTLSKTNFPKKTICKKTFVLPGKKKHKLAPINSEKYVIQCSNQRLYEEEKVRLLYKMIHLKLFFWKGYDSLKTYLCTLKCQSHYDEHSQKTWIQTQKYIGMREENSTKSLFGDEKIKNVYNQTIMTSAIQRELC